MFSGVPRRVEGHPRGDQGPRPRRSEVWHHT